MQTATIIKIGNSLGVRLKHQLIEELKLQPGDEVEVNVWREPIASNAASFIKALKRFENIENAFADIEDPAAWQREIRRDRNISTGI